MPVATTLKIKLFAGNDVLVAESEDERLWQRVLLAIQENSSSLSPEAPIASPASVAARAVYASEDSALAAFADDISTSVAAVQGACAPVLSPPYLHVNPRSWETFKKSATTRGPGAVSSTAMAATLLALWREKIGMSAPSVPECLAVLRPLGVTDNNAVRSIKNADWLQLRTGAVFVNPAERSRALEIARSFCSRS